MQQTQTYRAPKRTGVAADVETFLGNALATILAGLGVAAGVIGLLVAFDYISTTVNTPFDNGIIWMTAGLILAVSATVFRREQHITDPGRFEQNLPSETYADNAKARGTSRDKASGVANAHAALASESRVSTPDSSSR